MSYDLGLNLLQQKKLYSQSVKLHSQKIKLGNKFLVTD